MNKNALITVVIVTYNADLFLDNILTSLISRINNQTEVIIIDGLSTDNTMAIIKKYDEYIDKIVSEKDSGIYDAMNKGVSFATGKFIFFLGADDELLINFDKLSKYLIDDKTIYYGNVILSPSNKIYSGKYNTSKLIDKNICHRSIFYPKSVFDEFSFGSKYKYMEDYVMNLKLWASKKHKFFYINEIISIYNEEGLSSTNIDFAFKRDAFKIIYKYYGFVGLFIKFFNPIRNFLKIN